MENEPKYIQLSVRTSKETFTINGCGKFNESKLHLSKAEAYMLYIELHKWIVGNGK